MRIAKTYFVTNLSDKLGSELTHLEFEGLASNPTNDMIGVSWLGLMVVIDYGNGIIKSGLVEKIYL